jgi:hypothetical protein
MNMGLEILIERMKTNPEEWAKMNDKAIGRWESIVHLYWDYFTNEDKTAYLEARHEVLADEFSEEVLKILAGEETGEYVVGSSAWSDPRGVFHPQTNMAYINPLQQSQAQAIMIQKQEDLLKLQAASLQGQTKPKSFLDSVCGVFK